ncbi:hypothetical protein [Streptomyces virginiae]|uniref:hypothetical protein n=1 Tax=Streptomyces virginiae TaxID=1961 RepID=UPI0036369C42
MSQDAPFLDPEGSGIYEDSTDLEIFAAGSLMQKLVDLESMVADAPEEGGGPNWDKRNMLSAIDELKKHR